MLKKSLWIVFFVVVAYLLYGIGFQYMTLRSVADVPVEHIQGNPEGDLSVVEFLDYRCTYCKQAHPILMDAVARDGNIKLIIRPVVLVDPQSIFAARSVYAAALQGQFVAMHERLITEEGEITPEAVRLHAQSLGLDFDQLANDVSSPDVENFILQNHRVFAAVGTQATPTFVIGGKMQYVPEGQMPNVADFMAMFENARLAGFK